MSKPLFEIVDLGVQHPDYFQGFGTSFTQFEYSAYGIGMSAEEAYQEALESMAQSEHAERALAAMPENCPFAGDVPDGYDENWYHVGIRWNAEGEAP